MLLVYSIRVTIAVVAISIVTVFILSAGDVSIYFRYQTLPGQTYYVFSKLAGLLALFCLWLQLLGGLLGTQLYAAIGFSPTLTYHRALGLITLAMILLHIGLFVTAASLRNEQFAYKLLLPNFSDYYQTMISLGLISTILLFIAIVPALWNHVLSSKGYWLHRLSLLVITIVFWHAYSIGTEIQILPLEIVFWIMPVALLLALLYRYTCYVRTQKEPT